MRHFLLILCLFICIMGFSTCQASENTMDLNQNIGSTLLNTWISPSLSNADYAILSIDIHKADYFNYREIIGSSNNQAFNNSVLSAFDKNDKNFFLSNSNAQNTSPAKLYFLFYGSNKNYKVVDFTPYIEKIMAQIVASKDITEYKDPAFAECRIIVNKQGSVISREIYNSSNNDFFNKKVLNFIDKTLVLDPMNYDFSGNNITIEILFNIKQSLINKNADMRLLLAKIKANWHPPKSFNQKQTKVLFRIDKDGNVINQKIYESSFNNKLDKEAMHSIQISSPFKGFFQSAERTNYKDIIVDFDSNTYILGFIISPKQTKNHSKTSFTKEQIEESKKYIEKQAAKIKSNMRYNQNLLSTPKLTVVNFILNNQDKAVNCEIETYSDSEEFDNIVLEAVYKTKFDPAPSFLKTEQIQLQIPVYFSNNTYTSASVGLRLLNATVSILRLISH